MSLVNATGGAVIGSDDSAELSIIDNDPAEPTPQPGSLQLGAATNSIIENGGSVLLTVTRTSGSDGVVGVSYETSDVTASQGLDYLGGVGTLSFADGVTSQTISIAVSDDAIFEGDETFDVSLL